MGVVKIINYRTRGLAPDKNSYGFLPCCAQTDCWQQVKGWLSVDHPNKGDMVDVTWAFARGQHLCERPFPLTSGMLGPSLKSVS